MKNKILTKSEMNSFFFEDPIDKAVEKQLYNSKIKYYYFDSEIKLKTDKNQVLNGSLLLGNATLIIEKNKIELNQFDIFFIPSQKEFTIIGKSKSNYKIVLFYSIVESKMALNFNIQKYNLKNFINRGERSSNERMSTRRRVWTAFENGFFMSGITHIPNESLKTGVVTSVNLEKDIEKGNIEIYSHIHPEFPELYIFLIDDENYAITQYLINSKGKSVCKDLANGDGVFFPGFLGHINFAKPYYKNLNYCSYIWFIPTFGNTRKIKPVTLKI